MTLTTGLTLICILLALIAWRQILTVATVTAIAVLGSLVLIWLGLIEGAKVLWGRKS